MSYSVVPVQPISNQIFSITLGGQDCQIELDTKLDVGLFLSLWADGEPVVLGRQCKEGVGLVRNRYLPFAGELYWIDMQDSHDPEFQGFGDRYLLIYYSDDDTAA